MTQSCESGHFGSLLQDFRKRAGLTQSQLADFSTISVRAIRDLELGIARRPRQDTVRLLADGLRLTSDRRMTLELAAGQHPTSVALGAARSTQSAAPPRPAGPMFGRERELQALIELLSPGGTRLTTITGLAGVGKTRLALALAHEMHEARRTRVLWLAQTDDGQAHHQPDGLGQPSPRSFDGLAAVARMLFDGNDLPDLATLIADEPVLLVLDDTSESQYPPDALQRLVAQCPRLLIVLTTRSADSPGLTFPLRPLPAGQPDVATNDSLNPAAQLLAWHLSSMRPDLAPTPSNDRCIRQICWLLDGIPLALAGAAAWSLLLPLPQLAELAAVDPITLATPPSAQQTPNWLASTAADLLDGLSAAVLSAMRALSSRPGWSLDEAARITGLSLADMAHALYTLRVHDLVKMAGPTEDSRFTILHSIRSLLEPDCLALSA